MHGRDQKLFLESFNLKTKGGLYGLDGRVILYRITNKQDQISSTILSGSEYGSFPFYLHFVDRGSLYKFLLITNLTHFFMYLFIYFISLHVSNITVLIIRRSNCRYINTSSSMISLCK